MHFGYVKLHRRIIDSEVMKDADLLQLFVWCLCKAKWTEEEDNSGLKRGQFRTTRAWASEALGMHPSKWYRGMRRLMEMGNITFEANNERTTVTVCNYKSYQDENSEVEQRSNSDRTTYH